MASVADQKAEVILLCKVHTGLDMFLLCRHNNVLRIKAICARGCGVRGRQTGIVGIKRPEITNGVVDTAFVSIYPIVAAFTLTWSARPSTLQ